MLVLLDGAGNIAPRRDLPGYASRHPGYLVADAGEAPNTNGATGTVATITAFSGT